MSASFAIVWQKKIKFMRRAFGVCWWWNSYKGVTVSDMQVCAQAKEDLNKRYYASICYKRVIFFHIGSIN